MRRSNSLDERRRLSQITDGFRRINLLVVGDLMLDRFIWGDVERISPEAPVPVLRVTSESIQLGGAANVVHNIRTLGGQVTACGAVGRDGPGKKLLQDLRRIGVSTDGVFTDEGYQSIQKTRIIARPRHQQIVRLDRESRAPMREPTLKKIRDYVLRHHRRYDGIVVSDYGKGVIHRELLERLADLAGRDGRPVVIDPKKENYGRYRGATLITPNKEEASGAAGIPIRDESSLIEAGRRLVRLWRAKAVLITRGPEGMSLFRPRRTAAHFPTQPKEIFDVTGAGDTVVAVCGLALAGGASYEDAAVLANLAAGLVGDEVGTVAVRADALKRAIGETL
ncbi:MAG TPA: D-glycero-beta-D-manno-heptose-7-phosphate kinase [candidate division Zixibacteria bacterium]|nr:D-glycero-beta-D-manno-heptose-7-phosphate kinase [candidate division Zixibacteria bacterium]